MKKEESAAKKLGLRVILSVQLDKIYLCILQRQYFYASTLLRCYTLRDILLLNHTPDAERKNSLDQPVNDR